MIKAFANAWFENKNLLEKFFFESGEEEFDDYKKIVVKLFEIVINPYIILDEDIYSEYDSSRITEIDDGCYDGIKLFFIPKENIIFPSDYVWTNVYYGSCSYCDLLESILSVDSKDEQVKGLMELSLHILQKCKTLEDK